MFMHQQDSMLVVQAHHLSHSCENTFYWTYNIDFSTERSNTNSSILWLLVLMMLFQSSTALSK